MITAEPVGFAAALPQGGALIGLDLGTKTVGTAYCDAGWAIASPGPLIVRRRFAQDLEKLKRGIAHRSVGGVVLGLPLNLDGSDSPRTQAVRAFARNLAPLGLPVLLWDERWSTAAVERQMIAADVSRAKRAEKVDSAAAAYILQGAIDRLAGIVGAA